MSFTLCARATTPIPLQSSQTSTRVMGRANKAHSVPNADFPLVDRSISVRPYTSERKAEWDAFVGRAKNGLFQFYRGYMDYHADRFSDASLMLYDGARLCALFPASVSGDTLSSHAGLTFGGVVSDSRMTATAMMSSIGSIVEHARERRISRIHYKAIPSPFCRLPAQEDLYALFLSNARLVRRDLSSVIRMGERLGFSKGKKQGVAKAQKAGVNISETGDLATFMPMLVEALARHNAEPTHTLAEIQLLQSRFPENIRCFLARSRDGKALAGVVMYEYGRAVHAQYMANSEEGRDLGALDLLIDYLVNEWYPARTEYFSFGISTEQAGRYLNAGLCAQKEMFGARSVVHDHYELEL